MINAHDTEDRQHLQRWRHVRVCSASWYERDREVLSRHLESLAIAKDWLQSC